MEFHIFFLISLHENKKAKATRERKARKKVKYEFNKHGNKFKAKENFMKNNSF